MAHHQPRGAWTRYPETDHEAQVVAGMIIAIYTDRRMEFTTRLWFTWPTIQMMITHLAVTMAIALIGDTTKAIETDTTEETII
jgi:hypothetical protein